MDKDQRLLRRAKWWTRSLNRNGKHPYRDEDIVCSIMKVMAGARNRTGYAWVRCILDSKPNADYDGKMIAVYKLFYCWNLLRALLPQALRKQMLTVQKV